MIKKTSIKTVETASLSKKDGLLILIVMVGLLLVGVGALKLINWLDLDNKVDVSVYPGSEKATLTARGTTFIEDKYTSDKPSRDYYKVRLTADKCENVLGYYRTEAAKSGWISDKPGGTGRANVLVDSYNKNSKGLFIYCAPGAEQFALNTDGKNIIFILTADSIIDLNPSS